ncbi:MAG TPA: GFA family protein [Steroidobacteraceae bacterium]|nr:GFA family protein [Steroidobacteraceae bacterium]
MQGRCLCGAVTITTPENVAMNACHCGMCRRWGSSPYMSIHAGPDISISGADEIGTFRSSDWAERAFCRICGTHLYYRLIPTNDHELSIGLFQPEPEFQFTEQIFIDRKPRWYEFANVTNNLTEAEVFAKSAPP